MDTSRIEINIIDNSTSLIENPTAITGFTVVKAPKGPCTPIRINSGGTAAIKDIFGLSSKDYPELFEVETFNKEYDLWVSAPYTKATVPVAYVTDRGVFRGSDQIDYSETLEKIINGESDPELEGISIENFNSIGSDGVKCLLDTRYNKTQKVLEEYKDLVKTVTSDNTTVSALRYTAKDITNVYFPGFEVITPKASNVLPSGATTTKAVIINLGMPLEIFASTATDSTNNNATYWVAKDGVSKIRVTGMSSSITSDFDITKKEVVNNNNHYFEVKQGNKVVGEIPFTDDSSDNSPKDLIMYLYGDKDNSTDGTLTRKYVENNLDQEFERKALSTYFIQTVKEANVYGTIIPKYPSSRTLSIDFNAFSEMKGYSAKSWSARNILKMDVYEEGAFHNASHKIHVEGSLDSEARDGNGAKIGFIEDNATYARQNLIFVYSLKTFKQGDVFNKDIERYPSITLSGGTRIFEDYYQTSDTAPKSNVTYYTYSKSTKKYIKFEGTTFDSETTYYVYEENSTELHNLGWEKAKDGDFSDVDVFFDSELHTVDSSIASLKKSTFFSLANTDKNNHGLAGYYFNATLSPTVVEKNNPNYQLTFGRNYWNVDNQAIIMLDEGGSKIISPLTGAMALMVCRIIENRYGGVAPMWENTGTPSMGGQLRGIVDIYKLRYRYTKTQLDVLDDLNYNPVINDRQYGFMVVGQKTCQDGEVTDWSYIGHAAAFLNFIKEIRANVMIPQIGKANNPYYRTLRKEQAERYLARRLEGNNRIWAWGEVDTSTKDGVNDIYARKAKKFIIDIRVMVDTFSEKVVLNFTNEDQSTTVTTA